MQEGVKRGGRRVSRRISELLGKFEGGGESEGKLVELETGLQSRKALSIVTRR